MANDSKDKKPQVNKHHHYILPDKLALTVAGALLFLTLVTVWSAGFDLGKLNFPVAMVIATTKALLVCFIFMNLKNDARENSVIFFTSFLFLAIFIVLTGSDIFFRGDVYVKKGQLEAMSAGGKAKFQKAWVPTDELVKHGKELFMGQCVSCHGATGHGDGIAAGALVPKPRNFTADAGWKNGRKPSQIFKTLKEGIPGSSMASFSTLPQDDRWALAHYVTTLGPNVLKDSSQDLAAVGIDPNKAGGAEEEKTIPVRLAMERLTDTSGQNGSKTVQRDGAVDLSQPGARTYQRYCLDCHGTQGAGGIVRSTGAFPKAYVRSKAFSSGLSSDTFNQVVTRGLPGDLMPGYGHLSGAQLRDLYQYVRGLAAR
jgi:caa(3)-type oxidase subunit IV